jgi:phosphopantothenoylcysteine decarboxylase/phosphopantothenate--cysteine ligase
MGMALAAEARRRGADVVLIMGPTELEPPSEVEVVRISTTAELREAVLSQFSRCDVVMMAAAPLDWRPADVAPRKMKKTEGDLTVTLTRTPDILAEIGRNKGQRVLVGFAAETDELQTYALAKLEAKNLDLIVANRVAREPGEGFAAETNRVLIIGRDGQVEETAVLPKAEIARTVCDRVSSLLGGGESRAGGQEDRSADRRGD